MRQEDIDNWCNNRVVHFLDAKNSTHANKSLALQID